MSEEFVEADLDKEPEKVVDQEARFLFKTIAKKRKSLFLDYVYHWNRLLVACTKIQKQTVTTT